MPLPDFFHWGAALDLFTYKNCITPLFLCGQSSILFATWKFTMLSVACIKILVSIASRSLFVRVGCISKLVCIFIMTCKGGRTHRSLGANASGVEIRLIYCFMFAPACNASQRWGIRLATFFGEKSFSFCRNVFVTLENYNYKSRLKNKNCENYGFCDRCSFTEKIQYLL